jgi:hypothetical protein
LVLKLSLAAERKRSVRILDPARKVAPHHPNAKRRHRVAARVAGSLTEDRFKQPVVRSAGLAEQAALPELWPEQRLHFRAEKAIEDPHLNISPS